MMQGIRLVLHAERSFQRDAVDFFLVGREKDGQLWLGKPLEVETRPEYDTGVMPEPTFSLNSDEAQSFIDELWALGFRPREEMSLGAYQAQGKHLEDMRKIAFQLFGKMMDFVRVGETLTAVLEEREG